MREAFASKAPTVVSICASAILTPRAVTLPSAGVNRRALTACVRKALRAPCGPIWYIPRMHDDLEQRKSQHLDLVQRPEVEPEESDPLLSCVRFVHRAAPELSLDQIELSAELCGKRLRALLMIVGMTGGTEGAGRINRDLATLAEEAGVAFGVGSMRILLEQPDLLATFAVKPARPPLLAANLGAQQLVQRGTLAGLRVMEMLEADAIAIHLNAAQELVQAGGDRAFCACPDALAALGAEGGAGRGIVKETGCGIGPPGLRAFAARGGGTTDEDGPGGATRAPLHP